MKAVCYVRVSTEEQVRGGVSLDAQEERLLAYCKLAGLEIVGFFREEGVSAGKSLASRPQGSRLIEMLENKKADHIVTLKLDRLFRSAEDALSQTKTWDKTGVALHLVDMGGQTINTSTAMGRMFLTMMAGFAELERNLIAERTEAALSHKKAHKEVYGTTPFGFEREGEKLIENQDELEMIERIKTWKREGWSLRKIAEELNDNNVPTKKGGKWYASTVKYILENNLYKEAM